MNSEGHMVGNGFKPRPAPLHAHLLYTVGFIEFIKGLSHEK